MSALYRIDHIIHDRGALVIGIEARLSGHRLHRNERSACIGFRLPYSVHRSADFLKRILVFLSCQLSCSRIECCKIIWAAGRKMVCLAHEHRAVVQISESSDGKVTECIMVRGISSLRTEPPLVPSAEISVIESDLVIVQEVGGPASAGICKCGFRNHGITFDVRQAGIKKGSQNIPHLTEEPADRLLCLCHSELHLGHMSSFVD